VAPPCIKLAFANSIRRCICCSCFTKRKGTDGLASCLRDHYSQMGVPKPRSGQDMLRSRPLQECDLLATLQARPSEYQRACHPPNCPMAGSSEVGFRRASVETVDIFSLDHPCARAVWEASGDDMTHGPFCLFVAKQNWTEKMIERAAYKLGVIRSHFAQSILDLR
jgi:hypothetical protein